MRRLSRNDGLPALRGILGDLDDRAATTTCLGGGVLERDERLDELRLLWLECEELLDDR